jgi:cytidylate kinase/ASC-1-like (ASCH) protein
MQSSNSLMVELKEVVRKDPFWGPYLNSATKNPADFGIHLAVLVEPYLQYIMEGKKTVESRFSVNRIAPYGKVKEGDILLLKKSGGPIIAICQVGQVWFYELNPQSWDEIRDEFTQMLCAQDPEFWISRRRASYATLMRVRQVKRIDPVKYVKRDRRGWVVLSARDPQLKLSAIKKTTILGISGAIGSGKSSLSNKLAESLGWARAGFGAYVRREARMRNLPERREILQDIGARMVEDSDQFCRDVLAWAEWRRGDNLIIDGIRHSSILGSLKKLTKPSNTLLIYISIDEQTRLERIATRDEDQGIRLNVFDQHSTEIEVRNSLKDLADIVVDGRMCVSENVGHILDVLKVRRIINDSHLKMHVMNDSEVGKYQAGN